MQVMIVTKTQIGSWMRFKRKCAAVLQLFMKRKGHIATTAKLFLTIVTRFELPSLEAAMKESDPNAFVSISDNVKILGRFTKKITNKRVSNENGCVYSFVAFEK